MPNIASHDVDYISNVFILKLRLNKGMGWTQNVREPEGVTPHEYFNVAFCEVIWAPLWHRLTNCLTNLIS